jgi:hypothetical protein
MQCTGRAGIRCCALALALSRGFAIRSGPFNYMIVSAEIIFLPRTPGRLHPQPNPKHLSLRRSNFAAAYNFGSAKRSLTAALATGGQLIFCLPGLPDIRPSRHCCGVRVAGKIRLLSLIHNIDPCWTPVANPRYRVFLLLLLLFLARHRLC